MFNTRNKSGISAHQCIILYILTSSKKKTEKKHNIKTYVHKTEHLSIIFNNLFVNNSDIHHYKTRNASNLHKKYRRTNYVNHSLASKGVDIWNKLDSHLKSINSLIVFKSKLKNLYL